MRSAALLGLLGPAAHVMAHPAMAANPNAKSYISKRSVDLEAFRLPEKAEYVSTADVNVASKRAFVKRETYVETAEAAVAELVPGATFRVVPDHYVGDNGIAHVYLKQTAHGLDIDNADFNVNVSFI